jgi:MFS-type transporter involved in bile tolerance (Atg22 family)
MYVSTLVFMIEVLSIAFPLGTDSVGTAKIALAFATVNSVFGFTYAWKHFFRNRPALAEVQNGKSILFHGFHSLIQNSLRIHRELPAVRWFLLAVICGESGNAAIVTIGTTFMVNFLEMDGKAIGIVFLAVLIMGPFGAKLGEFIALRSTPVASAKVCCTSFIVTTSLAAAVLTGPERSQYAIIFGIFWGLCLGTWLAMGPMKCLDRD